MNNSAFVYRVSLLLAVLLASQVSKAQITGAVFRDFNGNGTQQTASPMTEPLQQGVIVNIFNASDQIIASFTTTSASAPNYSIPSSGSAYNGIAGSNTGFAASGTATRVEYVIPASSSVACNLGSTFEFSALAGVSYGTNVRFVTAGAGATNINYALFNPSEYVKNSSPNVLTYFSYAGDPLSTAGAAGTKAFDRSSIARYAYTSTGGPTLPTTFIEAQYIGSTYGIAYSKQSARGFSAAYLQHYIGLGPLGSGGIYKFDTTLPNANANFYDLDANGFPTRSSGRTFGSGAANSYVVNSSTSLTYQGSTNTNTLEPEGLSVVGSNSARGLATLVGSPNADPSVVGQIGIVGLGDLDISDDGNFLYTVNLYDRKVYKLTLNDPKNPTSVTAVSSFTIPNPPKRSTAPSGSASGAYSSTYTGGSDGTGFYDGTLGVQRPFALKPYRGKLYIGTVTTGEKGGSTTTDDNAGNPEFTDLWAYVWEFDPNTGTFNTTPVLQMPLNYNKGTNGDGINETWRVWDLDLSASTSTGGCCNLMANSQPMFTDIEFDPIDGSMILSIRDRNGDQLKYEQFLLDGTGTVSGWAYGDMLRAFKNPSGCLFELEKNGKEGPNSSKAATTGASNGGGPGGGEFYYDDNCCPTQHLNLSAGSLAILPGRNEILSTFADPTSFFSNGWRRLSNTDGSLVAQFAAYNNATAGTAGKSAGMGDIELIGAEAPTEIGNRVWNDANGDGIQNANESGIAGVLLELVDGTGAAVDSDPVTAGVQATLVTTDANGNWFLTSATGTDATGINYGIAFINSTLYRVRLATTGAGNDWDPTADGGAGGPRAGGNLVGLGITLNGISGNGAAGFSDNDAVMLSSIPQITFTTGAAGENNHNLDMGFRLSSLGDFVWRDDNKDGNQDAGEPGVAGIQVELYSDYNNDGDFLDAGENIPSATTTTDAYGAYRFKNLEPLKYQVRFALPPNYIFTPQTNAVDNTNGTQTKALGSDPIASTGFTYSINISAGEEELNIDAGIYFEAPPVLASVGDYVWLDLNSNGTQNAGEPGVSGVVVSLYNSVGTVVATTLTDVNGLYLFTTVTPASNYKVGFSLPSGMVFTTQSGVITVADNSDAITTAGVNFGKSGAFNVLAADVIRYIDAGIVPQASTKSSLGDYVWEDLNRDGKQDAGEPGIAGVTVDLMDNTGINVLVSTVTDALGFYTFNDLSSAIYFVKFTAPAGYTVSAKNQGSNIAVDSDMDPTTGLSDNVNLDPGARISTIDAGMYKTAAVGSLANLGDYVWFDYDRDGIQDATETGEGGVVVNLLNSSGSIIATTMTDVTGFYKFVNLTPAVYSIQFTNLPSGFAFTGKDLGGNDAIDSDADPANGKTAQVTLAAGDNNVSLDAGLLKGLPAGKGSLGNRVWYDLNNNGLQETGEAGTSGVVVTLKTAGADGIQGNGDDVTIASTATNALGEYIFTSLNPENYYVTFSNLTIAAPGYSATVQNAGTNDAIDSDGGAISAGASVTGLYSLAQGEDNMTVDLGVFKSAVNTIGNHVWFDINANGVQDPATEPGVQGVMVTLLDVSGNVFDNDVTTTGVQPLVTVTDASGYYVFTNLANGSYAVMFSNLPSGFNFTAANAGANDAIDSDPSILTGKTAALTVNATTPAGTPRTDISFDAGIVTTTAALGNFVWEDKNGDGLQDAGEPGISGVTVTLYTGAGSTPLATVITDQNGLYFFPNLTPGTYKVGFTTIPSNMEFTLKDVVGTDATDSDVDPATGLTGTYTLAAGAVNLTVDAGVRQPITAAVGDYVWNDINTDGIQNAGEAPIPGVIAALWTSGVDGIQNNGSGDDIILGAAITNGNGYYLITNVTPGSGYYVIFSAKPTGNYTLVAVGGTSGTNNSKASSSGITNTFTLGAGGLVLNLDAGINNLVPLPVNFIAMNCESLKTGTRISWTTADETDIQSFEIQRALGNSWISIATQNAKGGIDGNHYAVIDKNTENKVQVYRIVVLNKNGNLSVDANCKSMLSDNTGSGVQVVPNPTTGMIYVIVNATEAGSANIELLNLGGQKLIEGNWNMMEGRNQVMINMSQLPSGTYIVKTITNGITYHNKIIKQ